MALWKAYDQAMAAWYPLMGYKRLNGAWVRDYAPEEAWFDYKSIYWPEFLAKDTVLTRDVSNMPLHPNSKNIAKWVDDNKLLGFGSVTGLNRFAYSIPFYVVDSSVPDCNYMQFSIRQGGLSSFLYSTLQGMIPCPRWAVPAVGGDSALSIYDKGTGIMREYFNCQKTAQGNTFTFSAATGGYYIAKRGLKDLWQTNYAMQLQEGSNAVVKMLNPIGQIGIVEARMGEINHALQFTCANATSVIDPWEVGTEKFNTIPTGGNAYSWPAAQADGNNRSGDGHREGQWFRLPPDLDPEDPFYNFHPFTKVMIRAAKKYGGFATDKNLFVHAFNVEPGTVTKHWSGVDPWGSGGELDVQYEGLDITDFPWALTEWAPNHWGQPGKPVRGPAPYSGVGDGTVSVPGWTATAGEIDSASFPGITIADATTSVPGEYQFVY
jgi:hypothetical protein